MELEEFKKEYGFTFNIKKKGREVTAITEVLRKSDKKRMGGVKSNFDFYQIDDELRDSQSPRHLFNWSWDDLVEETKRAHLDHFAIIIPIKNFFPRNKETEIESLYI